MIQARPFEFSERVRKIIISIADAFIDIPDDLTINNKNDELIDRCQKIIRQFPFVMRIGFILGILLFDRLTLFFGFGFRRFAQLNISEQREYVGKWMNSPSHSLRNLITGLRGFVMVTFFSHKDIWKYINYEPVGHSQAKIALREKLLREVNPIQGVDV